MGIKDCGGGLEEASPRLRGKLGLLAFMRPSESVHSLIRPFASQRLFAVLFELARDLPTL
jgi:hypothetical protein